MKRVISVVPAAAGQAQASGRLVLAHDERRIGRKVLGLEGGGRIMIDFAEPVLLGAGDRLLLDDGSRVEVVAAPERLAEVRPRDPVHLAELCWHLGNRHLAVQIERERILIPADEAMEAMLRGLGAEVAQVEEPFAPVRRTSSGHGHHHGHHHDH